MEPTIQDPGVPGTTLVAIIRMVQEASEEVVVAEKERTEKAKERRAERRRMETRPGGTIHNPRRKQKKEKAKRRSEGGQSVHIWDTKSLASD